MKFSFEIIKQDFILLTYTLIHQVGGELKKISSMSKIKLNLLVVMKIKIKKKPYYWINSVVRLLALYHCFVNKDWVAYVISTSHH